MLFFFLGTNGRTFSSNSYESYVGPTWKHIKINLLVIIYIHFRLVKTLYISGKGHFPINQVLFHITIKRQQWYINVYISKIYF